MSMSFLSQCLFYFINWIIRFFSSDSFVFDITDNFKFALVGSSVIMMVVGFIVVFESTVKTVKYLDIPLIFLVTTLSIVFDIYVSEYSFPLPSLLGLIPGTICTVRRVKWFIDVVKKRRKPQKKNGIILVAYIVATITVFSLIFVDFDAEKQAPTQDEIQLLDSCYEYAQVSLIFLPTDKIELQKIAAITEATTENNVFIRAYDESKFHKDSAVGILTSPAKLKQLSRKKAYAEVVALRLKTLIALNEYEIYNDFFVDNCAYLMYPQPSYYLDLWLNDNYSLSNKDFDTIILGYTSALELCDNDSDRLLILYDIIDFYNAFEPDNIEVEKYEQHLSAIYTYNDLEYFFETTKEKNTYISKSLRK